MGKQPGGVELAVLSSMCGPDIRESLRRQRELGLSRLDLKDELFGREVLELTDEQARTISAWAEARAMTTYCLSTQLFGDLVERGEGYFRQRHLARVERVVQLARIFRPRMVRLLACRSRSRPPGEAAGEYLLSQAPWLLACYRQAITRLRSGGVAVVIENEVGDCVLADPEDVRSFFAALDLGGEAGFTWDVQNMWALGTPPSIEVYRRLRPIIRYLHLKGGRAGGSGGLRWRSSLREASWPVREIVAAVVADRVSPVVCLNPSHGDPPPGFDPAAVVADDLRFLRELSVGVT